MLMSLFCFVGVASSAEKLETISRFLDQSISRSEHVNQLLAESYGDSMCSDSKKHAARRLRATY